MANGGIKYRRSAATLSADQLKLLRDGFTALKGLPDDRGYRHWAGIHGLPLPIGCGVAHNRPLFLPWHRAYLYFFERALRDRVPDAMLAWWDWTATPPGMPAAFTQTRGNSLLNGPVDPLALQQWQDGGGTPAMSATTRRQPGILGSLPTRAEVDRVLAKKDFLDFSKGVEELHGRVHMWVGGHNGHMGKVPLAAFDPIFWAHHTMIDRVWRQWQLKHNNNPFPAELVDRALPPFDMTVRETLDVTRLGYDYAVASRSQPVAEEVR